MSAIQNISPLLDGFRLGDCVGSHDGIICCPAIQESTDRKYIIKVISIPASQQQMDALLLAGAYKEPSDAMVYFRQQGEDLLQEAQLLKKLSELDGFVSYDSWQMEPIPKHRLGYQVYLVGQYRCALDKFLRQHPVTHLEAMNLGLDLCEALSACRQAGYLFVNLKPSNIYVGEQKEYAIGDLGFISLDSLEYTVIPDRCRSSYTPPELYDPMIPVNLTVDTYAVGLILYKLYNDGQLPFRGKMPQEPLPSPVNADYELAEIIMRAIHPDPAQRWPSPKELGQALVDYMQRNSVNDSPISVPCPIAVAPDPVPAANAAVGNPSDAGEQAESNDETSPGEEDAQALLPHEMSDELSKIVAKADDLISHQPPAGVVVPEAPPEVDPFAFAAEEDEAADDSDVPYDPVMPEPKEPPTKKKKQQKYISPEIKRRRKRIITRLIVLLVLAAAGFCGYWYYQLIYLAPIRSLTLETGTRELSVHVDSDLPDSALTVLCQDQVGSSFFQELHDGYALFTDLQPNTTYHISLEVNGFHRLTGETSSVISTDTTTQILAFSATAGMEDGSVILEFITDGEEPEEWTLLTCGNGESGQISTFTGHSFTVSGLQVGKVYSFTLGASNGLSLSGQTSVDYLASKLITAQNITFASTDDSSLKVSWQTPGDIIVDSWVVRCYNTGGYEQKLSVTETEAQFSGIDFSSEYVIEITAAGMSLPAQVRISPDPICVSNVQFEQEASSFDALVLSWESDGRIPEGGWLLSCSLDGVLISENTPCSDNTAVISPRIPGGKYRFLLSAPDGNPILNSQFTLSAPQADALDFNKLTAEYLEGFLLKTPSDSNWRYDSVEPAQEFQPSESISMVLHATSDFYRRGDAVTIQYVIRDSLGNVLPYLCGSQNTYWHQIWSNRDYHYAQLTLPSSPVSPGAYEVSLYVNGQLAIALPFTVS